jgi:hypothetical protein
MSMKPIYGTTMRESETLLDWWLTDQKQRAIVNYIILISVRFPEMPNSQNSLQNAKDTIEKWIEDNFE